LSYLLVN